MPPPPNEENSIYKDPRFANLFKDPRYKSIHKSTQKIKIDKRFKSMFSDEQFNVKCTVDKYGRKVNQGTSNDLKKYYALSSSSSSESEVDEEKEEEGNVVDVDKNVAKDNDVERAIDGDDDDKLPEASDEEISDVVKKKLADLSTDYARGKGVLLSDSSSDDETSEDEDKNGELFIEHVWGELDAEAPRTNESSHRLAACNMDWDRIRASDIMVLCNSFLPRGGSIVSVRIYPSEFGKERMAQEDVKGPQELTEQLDSVDDESESDTSNIGDNDEEGNDYNMEKLRQYQLNRLKYYYAVIECDRISTADKLYEECDGLEYESTATKFDLRFIPDDMHFEDEPKDECTELPDMAKYQPRLFTTTALQQAKVELTWDENDIDRKELNEKLISGKLNEVGDQELRKYVAYSSEDDDPNESKEKSEDDSREREEKPKKSSITKYKALLQEIKDKEDTEKKNKIEMEFTWRIGGANTTKSDEQEAAEDATATKVEKTHFEKILEMKHEKKLARKAEKKKLRKMYKHGGEGLQSDSNDSDDDDLPDGIDMNDPYFAEEFANGKFEELNPSKKKLNKVKRKKETMDKEAENDKQTAELALLLDDDGGIDGNDEKAHFSLKKIQDNEKQSRKKKRQAKLKKSNKKTTEADNFELNLNDDRFAAVYASHLYSIDPTHANFRKTKGMEKLIEEKLKRRPTEENATDEPDGKRPKKDLAVRMLVKSIKRKMGKEAS